MDDINRSPVRVNLRDVWSKTIRDGVKLTFYNQRAQSLNQRFSADFKGRPVTFRDVPAFPFGLAEVFISPNKYRYKSIFVNVPAGQAGSVDEIFFVDPERVKPTFPDLSEIKTKQRWAALWQVLKSSKVMNVSTWNELSDQKKAGLFNLYAKMEREVVDGVDRSLVLSIASQSSTRPGSLRGSRQIYAASSAAI